MANSVTTRTQLLRLTGELVALRALVRRLFAHAAVLDGDDVEFLRRELLLLLDETGQFLDEGLSKSDRRAVETRAREIVHEVFTTIEIGGETLGTDG